MKVVNWFCTFFFLKECCSDGKWAGLEMRTCKRCDDNPDRKYGGQS